MSIPTTGVYMLRYRVVPSDVSVDYRFATDLKGDAQPIELALRTSEVQDKQYVRKPVVWLSECCVY